MTETQGQVSARQPGGDTSPVRAVREIITAGVVHRDAAQAEGLITEYLESHGAALVSAAATFIEFHLTQAVTPELAEDRFYYLLTRVGNLIDLAAQCTDVASATIVRDVVTALQSCEDPLPDREVQALCAAQTCLIAHEFVRRGRPSWGIQRSLDRSDMLVLNSALAFILRLVAISFPDDAQAEALRELLHEARHILSCQARAAGITLECLIERYFTALTVKETCQPTR